MLCGVSGIGECTLLMALYKLGSGPHDFPTRSEARAMASHVPPEGADPRGSNAPTEAI